jgi:L-ascorbate metabolism protein UlaG (beta-lactamase superfamily)
MIITSLGGAGIRLQTGDTVIVANPASKASKRASKKPTASGADICLVSLQHPDYDGADMATYGDREPFVIDGPGEYELSGIAVQAFGIPSEFGKEKVLVTAYLFAFDSMQVLITGPISDPALTTELREALENVDVMIVPIGGGDVLDGQGAWDSAKKIGAKLIVPVEYDWTGSAKGALDAFLKAAGATDEKPQDKLTIKLKDLSGKTGSVAVLS